MCCTCFHLGRTVIDVLVYLLFMLLAFFFLLIPLFSELELFGFENADRFVVTCCGMCSLMCVSFVFAMFVTSYWRF